MERIILNRLMFRLESQLSSRLYGFLPSHDTHHFFVELDTRLTSTSAVAFIGLKCAFDVANKEYHFRPACGLRGYGQPTRVGAEVPA